MPAVANTAYGGDMVQMAFNMANSGSHLQTTMDLESQLQATPVNPSTNHSFYLYTLLSLWELREVFISVVFFIVLDTLPPQPVSYSNEPLQTLNDMTPIVNNDRGKKKRRSATPRAPRSKKIKVEEQQQQPHMSRDVKPEPPQVSVVSTFFISCGSLVFLAILCFQVVLLSLWLLFAALL